VCINLTHQEAADRLNWPVGTVRGRLARGRALLRGRLERSGLGAVSCLPGTCARLELGSAQSVVGSNLVDTTARTAARLAAGQPLAEIVPARLAGLVVETSRTMMISKFTIATSLIVLAGLAAWGAAGLAAAPSGGNAPTVADAPAEGHASAPVAVAVGPASEAADDEDPIASYPFTTAPDKVRVFPELTFNSSNFQLTSGPVVVVPIGCEHGTTGVILIGNGEFRFRPEKDKVVEGHFRAAMLRFNPDDQPALIDLDKGKTIRDLGATERSATARESRVVGPQIQ
jgi:hypothetical protein